MIVERSIETILDILLPSDQVNPVEKLDLGYLSINNTTLLSKLWREVIACASIRTAKFKHLDEFATDSLAENLTNKRLCV